MPQIKITWTKSAIGYNGRQRDVIRALGLKRLHHSVVHEDSPTIMGMVNKVIHMLRVEEVVSQPAEGKMARQKTSQRTAK
jgi:large subunit ribosomal protein L30